MVNQLLNVLHLLYMLLCVGWENHYYSAKVKVRHNSLSLPAWEVDSSDKSSVKSRMLCLIIKLTVCVHHATHLARHMTKQPLPTVLDTLVVDTE